jgi:hypothetical protein
MKFLFAVLLVAASVPAVAVQQVPSPLGPSVAARRAVFAGSGNELGFVAASPIEREFGNTAGPLPGPVAGPNSVGGGPRPPPIPEPETWMLFILGFGGLGLALRRRRGRVTSA